MANDALQITVSFDALVDAIEGLSLTDKQRLLEVMERLVAEAEEEAWEQDPAVRAEMQAAREAYEAGDYVTIEDYLADQTDATKPTS